MKIDWRVSAITAGSAFLLSVVVGVFGNVSLGVLILRAVVVACVFGAGGIGAMVLIDRYLPELRLAASGPATAETGNTVNIVVEGDEELQTLGGGSGEDGSDPDLIDSSVADVAQDEAGQASADDPEGGQEKLEEGSSVRDDASDPSDSDVEVMEEVTSGDDLPNVDSMTDSFTEVPLGEAPVADSAESGEDPALMARAVRTLLKREE